MTASATPLGRVLIVDDEPQFGRMLHDLLVECGYAVKNAVHGRDALRLAEIFLPDVVLLDITMPVMNGLDALDRLRADHPSVPIIMLTGNSDREIARATLARGAFDYLTKPVSIDVLERAVAAAVASRP